MKQVLIKQGKISVEDVPVPQVIVGGVLVQVLHSCISAGTEITGLASSEEALWKKALKNPEKVKRAIEVASTQGVRKVHSMVSGKLSEGAPTGYSTCGRVIEIGKGITDVEVGDLVACAGAQCAHHAEYISVPRNLLVKVPNVVSASEASTVTMGAIALQGVRRANPTLGEIFVVVGLGILGQITAQLLKANGCKVIVSDPDKGRLKLSKEMGADHVLDPSNEDSINLVHMLTDGYGADGIIITAASSSSEIISHAFVMCRKKGRVVLVGDVGLNLKRGDFYQKEIDFFISTSYGPGRYDKSYEEDGLDYPISYVRWTENRNMKSYLSLIESQKLDIKSLISISFDVNEARKAYECFKTENEKPLTVILNYNNSEISKPLSKVGIKSNNKHSSKIKINLAVVGAGEFIKNMHFPNIKSLEKLFQIKVVVSRRGHNALNLARQADAEISSTDINDALSDPDIDAVMIATRHNSHGEMVYESLKAGKHVFVEKPLTLNREELKKVLNIYGGHESIRPILLTGFNRRFSPHIEWIGKAIRVRTNPMVIKYNMNAGYIPLDHWVHGEEGGGRNIGEACHIYDLFTALTNSRVIAVSASHIRPNTESISKTDNFSMMATFEDGSIASLTYTSLGHKSYPKEKLEIFFDGKVIEMVDYMQSNIIGKKSDSFKTKLMEKGHKQELAIFGDAIIQGKAWPIPLWQQQQAMEIAFTVDEMLNKIK